MAVWSVGDGDRIYLLVIIAVSMTVGYGADDYDYDSFKEPSICDESSIGLCFTVVNEAMDWYAAEERCKDIAGNSTLASVRSAEQQEFLAQQVRNAGLDEVWIGGCLENNFWRWCARSSELPLQGCFVDQEDDRDLVLLRSSPFITKPSQCIEECRRRKFYLAGVQLALLSTGNTAMLCHCGDDHGKHGEASDPGCNGACPDRTDSSNLLDARCGGVNRQLVFVANGSVPQYYFNWGSNQPDGRRLDQHACLSMKVPTYGWYDNDCDRRLPFLCESVIEEEFEEEFEELESFTSSFDRVITQLTGLGIGAGVTYLLLLAVAIGVGLWCRRKYKVRRAITKSTRASNDHIDDEAQNATSTGSTSPEDNSTRLPRTPQSPVRGVENPAYSSKDEYVGLHPPPPKSKGAKDYKAKKTRSEASYDYIDEKSEVGSHVPPPKPKGAKGTEVGPHGPPPKSEGTKHNKVKKTRSEASYDYIDDKSEVGPHGPPPKPKGAKDYKAKKTRSEASYDYIDDEYTHPNSDDNKSQRHTYVKLRGKGPPSQR